MNLNEEVKTALEELILEDKIQLLHASENFDAIMLLDRTETGHPLRSKFPLAFGPKRVKKPHWMPHWIAIKAIKD